MAEKQVVVDGLELNYNGLFDAEKLLKTIDELTAQRGYEKFEKKREELVKSSGKDWSIELRPIKKKSDWEILMVKMRIQANGITDVEVLKDGKKERLQKGQIYIIFDAWKVTDWEGRWEQKPWLYVLRTFFEKAFFKVHSDKYAGELIDDTHFIFNNVKAHLNLHRF
jgi:hypothetical protein